MTSRFTVKEDSDLYVMCMSDCTSQMQQLFWTGHSGASHHASGRGTLGSGPHLYRGLPADVQDLPLQPHGRGQEAPGVVPRPKSQGQGTLEKQHHNDGLSCGCCHSHPTAGRFSGWFNLWTFALVCFANTCMAFVEKHHSVCTSSRSPKSSRVGWLETPNSCLIWAAEWIVCVPCNWLKTCCYLPASRSVTNEMDSDRLQLTGNKWW